LPINCEENEINDEEGGVDMCKKLVVLCVALMLTSAVYAAEDPSINPLQINSWESGTLEAWTTHTGVSTLVPAATRGVTDGSYSMQILGPGMTWWAENADLDLAVLDPEGGIQAFVDHHYFSVDITVYQDEWVMDTTVGWTTAPAVQLLLNPGSGQWWAIGTFQLGQPLNGDVTTTVTWDYITYRNQIGNYQGVMKLILQFVDYGYLGASFYVDNAVLSGTPEPTTIALLGLGSLALLRRRK